MKKSVMLLALLCLLFVFQSVFAEIVYPEAISGLVYNGTDQLLLTEGKISAPDAGKIFFSYQEHGWREGPSPTSYPRGHFPGKYTVEWVYAENADSLPERTNKTVVTILEFNPPQPMRGLVEDGGISYLINTNTGKVPEGSPDRYYYRVNGGEWSDSLPQASAAGTYVVEYYLANPNNPPASTDSGTKFEVTIAKKSGSSGSTVPSPIPPDDPDDPQPINRVYDGLPQPLITAGKEETGKVWWYKLISFSNPGSTTAKVVETDKEIEGIPSDTWTTVIPTATNPGTYVVRCLLLNNNVNPENFVATDNTVSMDVTIVISDEADAPDPQPEPQPGPRPDPRPDIQPSIPFYYNGDGSGLFSSANSLPATGFPTRIHVPLSVKPAELNYEQLSMRIQIPSLNVDAELAGVPVMNGSWMVEWLGDRAGLLSGSAIPGEGYSMIAAHNHLNNEEFGPFALLFSLEENDRMFVNTAEDGLQIYRDYANELLEPDDLQKMASIAQREEKTMILVTCENEMVEGGYLNRRAIFAKPVF